MKDRLFVCSETKIFRFVYYRRLRQSFSFLWIVSASERRYNTVKALFKMGKIETYKQLVKQLPYSALAKDLKITGPRMKRLYANPGKMTLRELICLSKLLNIDIEKLEIIVFNEVEKCMGIGNDCRID